MTGSSRVFVSTITICVLVCTGSPPWGQGYLKRVQCSGIVADWQGRPVAGAEVLCVERVYDFAGGRMTWRAPGRTTTDRNGRFGVQMDVERVDCVWAVAWKERLSIGWQSMQWTCMGEDMALQLCRPTVLAGVVVDESGKPIAGATVRPGLMNQWERRLQHACFDEPRQWLAARTDEHGRFRVVIHKRGGIKGVVVLARDRVRNLAALMEIKDESQPVDVTLAPAVVVRGRIIDPNNKAIAGAPVSLVASAPAEEVAPTVFTNVDGVYEIPKVPAPSEGFGYWIHVRAQGYGPVSVGESSVNAPQNGQVKLDPIILTPADRSISGAVVDANGIPAAHVSVFVGGSSSDKEHQPEHETVADEEGRFSFDGVCAGLLRLQATNWSDTPESRGSCYAQGGDRGIKMFLGRNEVRGEPQPLLGKALPDLKTVLGSVDPNRMQGKPILLCFFDMQQRSSRNMVVQLAQQAEQLRQKGIAVAVVQASKMDETTLKTWVKETNVPFPVTTIQADEEKTRSIWAVKALPWLILTDPNHVVRAEGFAIDDLNNVLQTVK